tara:strand:+ start:195 stop:680 length:486 start_codon:yes stop_codon:yes gene_type:complete
MVTLPRFKRLKYLLTGLLFLLTVSAATADRKHYLVTIQTPEGKQIVYQVELAATPAERQQGLMFRKSIADGEGMLFVWQEQEKRSFWMKDTFMSLDILFFSHEKILISSHQNTVPFSVEQLPSGKPAKYVVELRAGQAQLRGLKPGSLLILSNELTSALGR